MLELESDKTIQRHTFLFMQHEDSRFSIIWYRDILQLQWWVRKSGDGSWRCSASEQVCSGADAM